MPADHAALVARLLTLGRDIGLVSSLVRRPHAHDPQMVRRLDEWSSAVYDIADALAAPPEAPDCLEADEWRVEHRALTAVVTITKSDGLSEMLAWAESRLRWLDAKLADLERQRPYAPVSQRTPSR